MKIIGTRIRQARENFGLSAASLANMAGVGESTLHAYESGKLQPSAAAFERLVTVLGQPADFYTRPIDSPPSERFRFRSLKRTRKAERGRARTALEFAAGFLRYLDSLVELPPSRLPDTPAHRSALPIEDVEGAAAALRSLWNLDDRPVRNLTLLAERNGIVVLRIPLDSPNLDGLSVWDPQIHRGIVVLNSDKGNAVRSRFDLAHEIAHLVLHRAVEASDADGTEYDLMERQAHTFAGALLLPASWAKNLGSVTLARLRDLKRMWGVSIAAQIMRAEQLGAIEPARKTSLMRQLSARGWRKREPLDDVLEPESPTLIRLATEALLDSNVVVDYPLRSADLERLTRLSGDSLSGQPSIELRPERFHDRLN